MDSKRMNLRCVIPKTVKRYLAWILTLAMIFSGVPLRGNGGVVSVSADEFESKEANIHVVTESAMKVASARNIEVKRLELDGSELMWDFRESTFGGYTNDLESGWTTEDGCLTIYGTMVHNGTQHGAQTATGNKFSINVPAGQTTITFGVCAYGSSEAVVKCGETEIKKVVLNTNQGSDKTEEVVTYTSEEDTVIDIELITGGFLHYIKAKAESAKDGEVVAATISYDNVECATVTAVYNENAVSDVVLTPEKVIFDEEPVLEKLLVTSGAADDIGEGYQVNIDTVEHIITVSHKNIELGNMIIVSVPYTVFAAAPIGTTESYDFFAEKAVFGSNPLAANTTVISENGYIKFLSEGESEVIVDNNHGLHMQGTTTFTMKIPANTMGVFTVNKCKYANCSASMWIDGEQQGAEVSLIGSEDSTDGTETVSFQHKNLSSGIVEMMIKVPKGGYIHAISYKVTEIPKEAVVLGTVGVDAAGQKLVFKNGSSVVGSAEIGSDGTYRVELPVGSSYTVEFEQADLYEITSDTAIDLTTVEADAEVQKDITYCVWKVNKSFSLMIGDTTFAVASGTSKTADFTAEVVSGSGTVELITPNTAIVWTDLGGSGKGRLSADKISVAEGEVTTSFNENVITVVYQDQTTNPITYTIIVKDNSASGIPSANGTPISYNFKDGSIVSELYVENYKISGGNSVKSTDGLLTLVGNNKIQYNGNAHGITISNTDVIKVEVAGDATIAFDLCQYAKEDGKFTASGMAEGGSISPESITAKVDTDGKTETFTYTGEETTLIFTYSGGSGYIHSMSVTNKAQASDVKVPQEKMPEVKTYGTKENLSVMPVGQRFILEQTDGSLKTTDAKIDSSVSYFGFEPTAEAYRLEADVVLSVCGASNYNGIFFGAFDENYIATVGIRNKTGLRGIFSKKAEDLAGAGLLDASIAEQQKVHFKAERKEEGFVITVTPEGGSENTATFKYNDKGNLLFNKDGKDTLISYGFVVSNATAIITNMKYYNAEGKVVYDQNDCYEAVGTAPVVSSVSAEAAKTRDFITVSWESSVEADGDGLYVVQAKEGNEWKDIAETMDTTCTYVISGEGDYTFRVCGKLGVNGERNTYVESKPLHVVAALDSPVVEISSAADAISLSWQPVTDAVRYEIYRYSYDEGSENVSVFAEIIETSYRDDSVTKEMPYYYYVVAYSENNYSNPSETVWSVPTAGHTGDYVYEDEATEIFITKKSYDTVFTNQVLLEGLVFGTGTISAYVNGEAAENKTISTGESFSFSLTVAEGRNDVNLIFTDEDGNKTRQTYNFVYLTHYDMAVDAAYSGTDGDLVNGIPTYKTVQAAVDQAEAGSEGANTVILVMAGDYKERLVVNTPYLSIIGEDREMTKIHFYPGELGTDYEAGGDMSLRCATYIQSGAAGFSAENISFKNDYVYSTPDGKSNKSADALRCDADSASFINVKFSSIQDTLYMGSGHQYYNKCRIEGVVDFIYSGDDARAFFNDCEIVFVYESTKTSGYICAPKTAANAEYGLTFYQCVLIGEEGCSGNGYLLARPWGPDAYITWIDCYMGKSIYKVLPYGDMSGNAYKEARFYEYGTYGPAFAINSDRRQISPNAAANMISDSFLGWKPNSVTSSISARYIGTVKTEREPMYVTNTYSTDSYTGKEGDDTGLRAYNLEGYAGAYGVSGGGLLMEISENYYKVKSAEEFLEALSKVKTSGKKSVIELTADISLGCYEVENFESYSSIIKPYGAQALTHPTLIASGVSILTLTDVRNLTIFSLNGYSIKHANITMKNSENIIIRNIKFDELWEWDDNLNNSPTDEDGSEGGYDRNDWDYMTIDQSCDGIWIDHCTFYKAYDGVIDVKNPADGGEERVTISWCEFLPGSEGDAFFDIMMKELSQSSSKYPYYQHLREHMTEEQIYQYAYGQKKTHLFGQSDTATNAKGIRATLANNYYKNSMDRMPRIRYGYSHVYNCIMDSQELLDARREISESAETEYAQKIVSNGASSTCGAQVLLENCYINGIQNALNSGNGDSVPGYINAVKSVYYMDQVKTDLEPKNNSSDKVTDKNVLITDEEAFKNTLPYNGYILYNAEKLDTLVKPSAGAEKLELTVLQWEKTAYNDSVLPDTGETDEPETTTPEETESTPEETESTPEETESTPEETESTPEETESTPEETESTPEETESTPEETETTPSDDSDDSEEDTEQETISLTNREENLIESVLGISSVKEVTESSSGKLVVAGNNEVVFFEKDGTLSRDKWQQVENSWYFFGTDSKAVSGWLEKDGKWYHLNETNKKMETGWLKTADGKWYLLDGKNGDMKTGWQQTADGKWYLLDGKNGDMKTGWQQTADGKWYLLDGKNGDMKTGWQQTADGKWYLLDGKNGDMKIGWQLVKNIWYYLTATGAMAEDTITPDGYKVGKDGAWRGERVQ